MIKSVPLEKACRLLNPGPTVLVSSKHGDKRNVMAASWSMALDFNPPKVCVVIAEGTYTRELVDASGVFALNIPARPLAEVTLAVGHHSGREFDKFQKYALKTFGDEDSLAPLIEGCVGWLECKVVPEPSQQQRYDLFIGEVVRAWADDGAFEQGHFLRPPPELQTLHYIAGGHFFVASEFISFEIKE